MKSGASDPQTIEAILHLIQQASQQPHDCVFCRRWHKGEAAATCSGGKCSGTGASTSAAVNNSGTGTSKSQFFHLFDVLQRNDASCEASPTSQPAYRRSGSRSSVADSIVRSLSGLGEDGIPDLRRFSNTSARSESNVIGLRHTNALDASSVESQIPEEGAGGRVCTSLPNLAEAHRLANSAPDSEGDENADGPTRRPLPLHPNFYLDELRRNRGSHNHGPCETEYTMKAMDVMFQAGFYDYIKDETNVIMIARYLTPIFGGYSVWELASGLVWLTAQYTVDTVGHLLSILLREWQPDVAGILVRLMLWMPRAILTENAEKYKPSNGGSKWK